MSNEEKKGKGKGRSRISRRRSDALRLGFGFIILLLFLMPIRIPNWKELMFLVFILFGGFLWKIPPSRSHTRVSL
jgi:hypothetical protein